MLCVQYTAQLWLFCCTFTFEIVSEVLFFRRIDVCLFADVPISNMLLSAQSGCFCMYCNLTFDLRLLLCIVSKAYQAGCCAYMLIKHSFFFPELQESLMVSVYFFTPQW